MVQIETSNYLDGKTAKGNGTTKFSPLEELTYQEGKFGRKLQGKAKFNGKGSAEGIISLNKTNQKKCAEATKSTDSKDWIGKWFDIVVTQQVVEGKLQDVIYVTGLSQTQTSL